MGFCGSLFFSTHMSMNPLLLQHIHTNFEQELSLASQNHKTSLAFILNTIPDKPFVKNGDIFQAIAIGGSMYRNAILKKHNGKISIQSEITDKLPLFALEEDFLSFIDAHIDTNIEVLALNLAYPLEPVFENGRLDGKLMRGTKEHTFAGLVNKKIGKEIETYMWERHKKKIIVSVANDTVCLILSGLQQTTWDHLVAGVLGTGLNFAIFLDKHTIVNLEAARFDKFPQTETGKAVDACSNMKGYGLFEKEVSGAYLYQHFNQLVLTKQIDHEPLTDTTQLSNLAEKNIGGASDAAQEQLERSAAFAATQIAGIASFKKQPMTFIMQGSLFWKGYKYKETVEKYLQQLIPDYRITFISIADSDVLGAAKLVS